MKCQICAHVGLELFDICPACFWEQDESELVQEKGPGIQGMHWSSANGCTLEVARDRWAGLLISRKSLLSTLETLFAPEAILNSYAVKPMERQDWDRIWNAYLKGRLSCELYGDFQPVTQRVKR